MICKTAFTIVQWEEAGTANLIPDLPSQAQIMTQSSPNDLHCSAKCCSDFPEVIVFHNVSIVLEFPRTNNMKCGRTITLFSLIANMLWL